MRGTCRKVWSTAFQRHHPILQSPNIALYTLRESEGPSLDPFQRIFRRSKLSAIHEPPLDSTVLEKPCTLLLLEDTWRYHTSWRTFLESNVPTHYGMAYATVSLERGYTHTKDGDIEGDDHGVWKERVEELKEDLSKVHHDAVLIARGPIASWTALLYLESLPLNGLVMVDPIQFDDPRNEVMQFSMVQNAFAGDNIASTLLQQVRPTTLKLEPNSVPMLILHSINDMDGRRQCDIVASRHGDPTGPFGLVEVRDASEDPEAAMQEVDEWIESIL
jgi:hypothetical protein